MTADEWLRLGIEAGYCSEPVCGTHDMAPMSDDEEDLWNEGDDLCVFIVRLWGPT